MGGEVLKPDFIDNRQGNLLSKAILGHLGWLRTNYREPVELSIASGYFDPYGFAILADELEKVKHIRLLLGAEPSPVPTRSPRQPGEPTGSAYERLSVEKALKAYSEGLESDRNLLAFEQEVDASVRRLITFIDTKKIEVKRYEKAFLHGKAYIFSTDEGVMVGSSNFTAAGLTRNLELNLGRYDPGPVGQVFTWFNELWEEAVPFDLASIYSARFEEYDPYLIYLRVLWELYGDELGEEARDGIIKLTSFQKDGLFRARLILDRYNGVIFADGVGLGKTFIGGDLIREVIKDHRQRALLIAPAALRDGTWQRFSERYQLYLECVSYEQLMGDPNLGGNGTSCLKDTPDRYSLIVIDEAQAFRNPDTNRAQALRALLRGEPPKKIVLLSATPVNNSLWDLYYLLTYFIGHDAVFADKGVLSLKKRFEEAMAEDPYELSPDLLFDILDATTVRRTRNFIKKYYPHDRITTFDGLEVPIRFPKPKVRAVHYDLQSVQPRLLIEFAEVLAPADGPSKLTMARYAPTQFIKRDLLDEEKSILVREMAIVGLLRSALLKRLESSSYAFANTLNRMIEDHEAFLKAMDLGYIPAPEALMEWESIDTDDAFQEILERTRSESATDYDIKELRVAITNDIVLLQRFREMAQKIKREEDPKLIELKRILIEILRKSEEDGTTTDQVRNNSKVVIFSYFKDTVEWIKDWLAEHLDNEKKLSKYRGRMVSVVGSETYDGISREAAIFGFAPQSTDAPPGKDTDRFDILLTTDVLAEGQNLQQARNIINYDLPWNPMRLVQRHGRIDRLGSPHSEVFIWCFFPDKQLDILLGLEERLRRKLAQAAASVGVESQIIPEGATSDHVFAETKKEIDALKHERPDLFENAGEDPSAHSGEEYRQELRKGIETLGDKIKNLAWAVGSGFKSKLANNKGYFFCARIGDRKYLRFVPEAEGVLIKDTLQCLKRISCSPEEPRIVDLELLREVYDAWNLAKEDIMGEWMRATDPRNLQPKVRPLFKKMAEHLRRYPPQSIPQEEIDKAIEAIEAPWGLRIERQFRIVFDEIYTNPTLKSEALVKSVSELGLQPFRAPKPLPPIETEDIHLICWLVIS